MLTIIGIVLTVTFGTWALALGRRKNFQARIQYVHGTLAPLFNLCVNNLSHVKLDISYQGGPLPGRSAILQGALQNCGAKDITAAMVKNPLTLRLKPGWRFLYFGNLTGSPELQSHLAIQYDPESAVVAFGPIMRRGEWLAFSALLELDELVNRSEFPIIFEHRIADLLPIEKARAPRRWGWIILLACCSLFTATLAGQKADRESSPKLISSPGTHAGVPLPSQTEPASLAATLIHFFAMHKGFGYFLLVAYAIVLSVLSRYYTARRHRNEAKLPAELRPDAGLPREFQGF